MLFERTHCSSCDELHREAFRRKEVAELLPKFEVARLTPKEDREVITSTGRKTTVDEWARQLKIVYAPTWVFFDASGEVFRVESYTRPFHLASALEYVSTGAYRSEPSFQRFVQARADRLRASGHSVDLWK